MKIVNNCFNCKNGRKITLILSETSDMARCKDPTGAEQSNLAIVRRCGSSRVYVLIGKDTPGCWKAKEEI